MDGSQRHCQRTEDGRFVLYQIGFDGLDHHDRLKLNGSDEVRSDWAWRYP